MPVIALLGLVVVYLVLYLIWSLIFNEESFRMKLHEALHQSGRTPQKGVQFHLRWETRGRSKCLFADYSINLDDGLSRSLSIMREGAKSGALAERGMREQITGDVDFDDYFWVKSGDPEYLTSARRQILLYVFQRLSSSSRVENGVVKGTVHVGRYPGGEQRVIREIETAAGMAEMLREPERWVSGSSTSSSIGWVARKKCRQAGWALLGAGLTLLLLGGTSHWANPTQEFGYSSLLTHVVLGTSMLILLSSGLYFFASPKAFSLASVAGFFTSVIIFAMLPLFYEMDPSPPGRILYTMLAFMMVYGVYRGYHVLTRIRLG